MPTKSFLPRSWRKISNLFLAPIVVANGLVEFEKSEKVILCIAFILEKRRMKKNQWMFDIQRTTLRSTLKRLSTHATLSRMLLFLRTTRRRQDLLVHLYSISPINSLAYTLRQVCGGCFFKFGLAFVLLFLIVSALCALRDKERALNSIQNSPTCCVGWFLRLQVYVASWTCIHYT